MASTVENPQLPNPLADFDKRTQNMTDLREFLALLATDGVPVLSSLQAPGEPKYVTEERWVGSIGIRISNLLANRARLGLPNHRLIIMSMMRDPALDLLFQEFVIDSPTKTYVQKGILLGLGVAGVIPPSVIIPQRYPIQTVEEYFNSP